MSPNRLDPETDTPKRHMTDFIIPTQPVLRDSLPRQASQFLMGGEVQYALRKVTAYSQGGMELLRNSCHIVWSLLDKKKYYLKNNSWKVKKMKKLYVLYAYFFLPQKILNMFSRNMVC